MNVKKANRKHIQGCIINRRTDYKHYRHWGILRISIPFPSRVLRTSVSGWIIHYQIQMNVDTRFREASNSSLEYPDKLGQR